MLLEESLRPLGVTQVAPAARIGASVQRVNELVKGKRGITPDTAWLLAQALGITPELRVRLQTSYDLARNRPRRSVGRLAEAG